MLQLKYKYIHLLANFWMAKHSNEKNTDIGNLKNKTQSL